MVRDYSRVVLWDINSDKKQENTEKKGSDKSSNKKNNKSDSGKWSMDWGSFDWEAVLGKIEWAEKELARNGGDKVLYDIGITEEQFEEYFQWLYENAPEEYEKLMLYVALREKGMEEGDIEFCLSHPEELKQALEMMREKGEIE